MFRDNSDILKTKYAIQKCDIEHYVQEIDDYDWWYIYVPPRRKGLYKESKSVEYQLIHQKRTSLTHLRSS